MNIDMTNAAKEFQTIICDQCNFAPDTELRKLNEFFRYSVKKISIDLWNTVSSGHQALLMRNQIKKPVLEKQEKYYKFRDSDSDKTVIADIPIGMIYNSYVKVYSDNLFEILILLVNETYYRILVRW